MKAQRKIRKKYSFATEEQAKQMIQVLYQGEEDYIFKSTATIGKHSVVYLGRLVKIDAVIEGDEVVEEAVLYDDYAVDVAWYPKFDIVEYDADGNEISREVAVQDWESWELFEIEVENPKHSFI